MAKITDKERLDWLLDFQGSHSTINRWEAMLKIYYDKGLSPRKALDAAIRQEGKV